MINIIINSTYLALSLQWVTYCFIRRRGPNSCRLLPQPASSVYTTSPRVEMASGVGGAGPALPVKLEGESLSAGDHAFLTEVCSRVFPGPPVGGGGGPGGLVLGLKASNSSGSSFENAALGKLHCDRCARVKAVLDGVCVCAVVSL